MKRKRKYIAVILLLSFVIVSLPLTNYKKASATVVIPIITTYAIDFLVTLLAVGAGYQIYQTITYEPDSSDPATWDYNYLSPTEKVEWCEWYTNTYSKSITPGDPHISSDIWKKIVKNCNKAQLEILKKVNKFDPNNKQFSDKLGNILSLKIFKDIYEILRIENKSDYDSGLLREFGYNDVVGSGVIYGPFFKNYRQTLKCYSQSDAVRVCGVIGKKSSPAEAYPLGYYMIYFYGIDSFGDEIKFSIESHEDGTNNTYVNFGHNGFGANSFSLDVPTFNTLEKAKKYLETGDSEGATNEWRHDETISYPAIEGTQDMTVPDSVTDMDSLIKHLSDPALEPIKGILGDWVPNPEPKPDPDPDVKPNPEPNPDADPDIKEDDFKNNPLIVKKFPFCIPFDLIDTIRTLKAEPEAPVFNLRFYVPSISFDHTVVLDLSVFESVAKISRCMFDLLFILGLVLITRNVIRG